MAGNQLRVSLGSIYIYKKNHSFNMLPVIRKNILTRISFCPVFTTVRTTNRYAGLPSAKKTAEQKGNPEAFPLRDTTLPALETETLPVTKSFNASITLNTGEKLKAGTFDVTKQIGKARILK